MMTRKEILINMVNDSPELLAEFAAGWGGRTIEEYLDEYAHVDDIVDLVAYDLNILLTRSK